MAHPLQSGPGMVAYCTFSGSYYDQSPWTEQMCAADAAVPAGCPIHFVTGASVMPSDVTATLVANDGTRTPIASTATLVDTDPRTFSLPDEFSCDCARESVAINFGRFSVDVPSTNAGDLIEIQFPGFSGPTLGVEIAAAGACPAPDWPVEYDVGLACDLCPMDPRDPDDPTDAPDGALGLGIGGCSVGADPSLLLVGLGLLPLLRRRRVRQSPG